MLSPSPSPSPSPSRSPLPSPSTLTLSIPSMSSSSPLAFSPTLIAMVVVVAAAFVAATYSRLISRHVILLHRRYRLYRRRRRLLLLLSSSSPDLESSRPPSDGFHVASPYGLDDSVIKSIPLSSFSLKNVAGGGGTVLLDCAVCLLEFEDRDCLRTLPACGHSFHVDCIDVWLRSHANCPLCRTGITFRPEPVMASRIRPSLEDMVFFQASLVQQHEEPYLEPLVEAPEFPDVSVSGEIQIQMQHDQQEDDLFMRRDFLMKRSYSFSFERNLGSERLAFEPATTSPWRCRKGFWGKRASPFGSVGKPPRVFSFRYYHRGMKSPFFRRRGGGGVGGGFFPLSERGGSSSRRSKSMASPMFMRSAGAFFSSSRMRSGDPEALLSPERFNRR